MATNKNTTTPQSEESAPVVTMASTVQTVIVKGLEAFQMVDAKVAQAQADALIAMLPAVVKMAESVDTFGSAHADDKAKPMSDRSILETFIAAGHASVSQSTWSRSLKIGRYFASRNINEEMEHFLDAHWTQPKNAVKEGKDPETFTNKRSKEVLARWCTDRNAARTAATPLVWVDDTDSDGGVVMTKEDHARRCMTPEQRDASKVSGSFKDRFKVAAIFGDRFTPEQIELYRVEHDTDELDYEELVSKTRCYAAQIMHLDKKAEEKEAKAAAARAKEMKEKLVQEGAEAVIADIIGQLKIAGLDDDAAEAMRLGMVANIS